MRSTLDKTVELMLDGLSTSNPFLDLSRRLGVRYGAVLLCADVFATPDAAGPHHIAAYSELGAHEKMLIAALVDVEAERRRQVAWENDLCPGHVASDDDQTVCRHCGARSDEERPPEEGDVAE